LTAVGRITNFAGCWLLKRGLFNSSGGGGSNIANLTRRSFAVEQRCDTKGFSNFKHLDERQKFDHLSTVAELQEK
jgi:hypothetical protein